MNNEKKEFGGWWLFTLGLIVISIVVFAILNYNGKVFGTMIENKVFQESYQRKSGLDAERARYEAELAKVNFLLMYEKNVNVIKNLKAQKAMLEVQIETNKRKR